jgi:hypothetical protein
MDERATLATLTATSNATMMMSMFYMNESISSATGKTGTKRALILWVVGSVDGGTRES